MPEKSRETPTLVDDVFSSVGFPDRPNQISVLHRPAENAKRAYYSQTTATNELTTFRLFSLLIRLPGSGWTLVHLSTSPRLARVPETLYTTAAHCKYRYALGLVTTELQ